MCVLPLNIINEKIYVFLWFWFVTISAVTAVQMVYRFVLICYVVMISAVTAVQMVYRLVYTCLY